MQPNDAIAILENMPAALEGRLAGLSEADWRFKPAAEVFSALESVCHLRDIEVEGYALRLRLMLETDEPLLPDLDGSRLARERRYQQQAPAAALEVFLVARRGNLQRLKCLTEADLKRRGRFENVGELDLSRLLQLWAEHDLGHLQELNALLAALRGATPVPKASLSLAR